MTLPAKITIPLAHLHPILREHIIGTNTPVLPLTTMRKHRGTTEIFGLSEIGIGYHNSDVPVTAGVMYLLAARNLMRTRPLIVDVIHLKHQAIAKSIKDHGILGNLDDETRQKYGDSLKVSTLVKTHPIFYVKGNGDLVFVKNSRAEYYRYKAQEALPGKIGIHPWRWRAYLQPPTAPESVKEAIKKKVARLVEKITPEPLPTPAKITKR